MFGLASTICLSPMHEYDVALKNILTRPGSSVLAQLTGASSLKWINVEAPRVSTRQVVAGGMPDGNLVHIELQSRNERDFPLRMVEYLFGIGRQYGRLPRQVALYVGEAPLRMKDRVEGPDVSVRFHLVDIRDLDGERLLASANIGDNVLAVLTKLSELPKAVRRILERIAAGSPEERDQALAELIIIAALRKLTGQVKREAEKMPILNDFMNDIVEDEVIGPLIRKRLVQGRVEARVEGQVEMLIDQIEKRFGRSRPLSASRITALKPAQLQRAGLRLLDAQRIEDLFGR